MKASLRRLDRSSVKTAETGTTAVAAVLARAVLAEAAGLIARTRTSRNSAEFAAVAIGKRKDRRVPDRRDLKQNQTRVATQVRGAGFFVSIS